MSEQIAHARLERRDGARLTVIELLIAVVLIGILLAIAVPSYRGLRERAWDREARANVAAAVPAVDAYARESGTYAGMTLAVLRRIDPSVELDADPAVTRRTYCIESSVHGETWHVAGPGAPGPTRGACS